LEFPLASESSRLSIAEKIGYGSGDFASNLFWQMFSIFIAKYYTDVFLLSAATMGTMMFVTRLADAFIDPMIGALADRTHTRWGHFRPYLLWMAIPMAATAVLTFTVPSFGGTAKLVYAYVTLSLMMVAYSAINIPYSGLLGVLTPSSAERTSVCSYRFVMALLPVFIIVNTALPLATRFGGSENSAAGWQMTMLIYSIIAIALYFTTFAMTRERVKPERRSKGSFRSDIKDLGHNRPWMILCIVGVSALAYANIRGTVSIYYFQDVVPNGNAYFGRVMTTGAIAFILGVMVTSPLSRVFGKRNFYMASMALSAVLTCGFYFVPPENIGLVWASHALISFCAAPTAPLVWAMYADTADYSEWKNGRRATGLVFSAASFAQKFGWAIGGAGTGWLLAYFGYLPNVAQNPTTIVGIKLMMSFIPAVGAVIAVIALWFYELDEEMVTRMSKDLSDRRAQDRQSTSEPYPQVAQHQTAVSGDASRVVQPHSAFGSSSGSRPVMQSLNPAPGTDTPLITSQERAALRKQCDEILSAGIHGWCFSPYLKGQGPGSPVSEQQIRTRLQLIRPHANWIRTFSCTNGNEHTPRIAHELGLKTLAGAWLGPDHQANVREIENLIRIARLGHVDLAAVGNEALLRDDLPVHALLGYIHDVKAELRDIPVGYVDAYYMFEKYPQVTAACDVVLANCYPFWEGCSNAQAGTCLQTMFKRAKAAAMGKPVIISETGWPEKGSALQHAAPSADAALSNFVETARWAKHEGIEIFYFEAFDEPWKVGTEGDVGAHWGMWDANGLPKYSGTP
jgi:GPH family glycoside/pentoside/hexuronide:cation symporter